MQEKNNELLVNCNTPKGESLDLKDVTDERIFMIGNWDLKDKKGIR